ncbi:MAG: HAMP domain-containing histidine kinase [Bacteroidetes bacterium]|nr:HAMP domain-containing histidine kinase [Bacteroidota bacterium]MCW5894657.1 HAMP domain-containing histidine kinase [Bacteroidota bacterium]
MKLSKQTIGILVAGMAVALGGILFLQYRFLQRSLELKDQTFRQNVLAALNAAVAVIEEADARDRFLLFVSDSTGHRPMTFSYSDTKKRVLKRDSGQTVMVSAFTTGGGSSTALVGDKLSYQLGTQQKVTVKVFDPFGKLDTVLVDAKKGEGKHELTLPGEKMKKGVYIIQVRTDSLFSTYRWDGAGGAVSFEMPAKQIDGERIISRITQTVAGKEAPPLSERINNEQVDSVVARFLQQGGIDFPYEFEVRDKKDSLVAGRVSGNAAMARESAFTVPVFSHDFSGMPATLMVRFPDYKSQLMKEFIPESVLHLLFVGVVLASFGFTVRTMLRQKELGERVTDFINNMTHEFKTPLSTIALASEALRRPDVLRMKKKIAEYNNVIADENTRMRKQIEKILHMAALEEGEVEFRRELLDVHAIIDKAVAAASVPVSTRGGTLTTLLDARRSIVAGDSVHIENVIRNVLDNAEKYSSDAPTIVVTTGNSEHHLVIRVIDHGIGMAQEHAARAFEKYYRVPTGNLHDVKGFGIGLSYVKLVVEKHGGTASIQSEKGSGTTVELRLPVVS